ncbi:MAG TPA: Dam family site-specific DNA-(adenine-N6)-methyltransferase [Methylococcus sp.]|nr:Dam family site-specific DNA-(adenine-N6)-methyltransferase [Methylococcus sp.]
MTGNRPLRPLFRWPGGKRWLVPKLLEIVPDSFGRYFEPFLGAGALFFALRPHDAVISDANTDLMRCYEAIRDCPDEVMWELRKMPTDAASYYRIRGQEPTTRAESAARFIYLTAHAFNGIYRVNHVGKFNVPFGGRDYGDLADEDRLSPYSEALRPAAIRMGDFEAALEGAASGDVVYLDPPYTVKHSNNGFVKYNQRLFSWEDQKRLAATAKRLDRQGCVVIVSNAHHESIRELYSGFRHLTIPRHSVIAAHSVHRNKIEEYLFTNAG